jgi:hypothetical protein
MMIAVILFMLCATNFYLECLRVLACPQQKEMQGQNFHCRQSKADNSQYSKKITIWKLEKNKFT